MRIGLKWEWEVLDENTMRAKVIGGWIVLHHAEKNKQLTESMAFVSDRDHGWQIIKPLQEKPIKSDEVPY